MATNTGKSHQQGAVTGRTQARQSGGGWQLRNVRNGQVVQQKASSPPFKGVAKNADAMDTAKTGHAKDRVQIKNPVTGRWIKVDTSTGRIIDEKLSEGPYKGIAIRSPGKQPKN